MCMFGIHIYKKFRINLKVIPPILQARLQQYLNHELPDVQAGFTEEPEIKLPTSVGS